MTYLYQQGTFWNVTWKCRPFYSGLNVFTLDFAISLAGVDMHLLHLWQNDAELKQETRGPSQCKDQYGDPHVLKDNKFSRPSYL